MGRGGLNVHYESSGISPPPGRGKDRGAPDEVAVEPSENVVKRAEALSEVLATIGDNHPEVQRFRRKYLHGRLLTDEEARSFLDDRGSPQGTGKAVRKTAPNPKWSLHPQAKRYSTPIEMRELIGLGEKLRKTYGWREGDGLWFVLTGYVPPIRPLEVEMFVHASTGPYRYYNPITPESLLPPPLGSTPRKSRALSATPNASCSEATRLHLREVTTRWRLSSSWPAG